MSEWMVWISCARYPQRRKRKRSWYYRPSEGDDGGSTVLSLLQRSRWRYFWHSWYVWDADCAAWPVSLPLLLLALALLLLGLHRCQDLQLLRDKIGRIRSGGSRWF